MLTLSWLNSVEKVGEKAFMAKKFLLKKSEMSTTKKTRNIDVICLD